MIVPITYRDKTVGVFGLARTGISAVQALRAAGANIWAWDDAKDRREQLDEAAVNLYEADFSRLDALVLSPGVPLDFPKQHPLVKKAREADVPIIGDMELFSKARRDLSPHSVVAITGTNGKSTTAALIAHMLEFSGRPVGLGGNIGIPVLSLSPLPAGGVYVFEMSSFQIDLTQSMDADIAVLLNITPDHLDRHGDFSGYVAAKRRLFEMQGCDHLAVIGVDDAASRGIAESLSQTVVPVSLRNAFDGGVCVDADGALHDMRDDSTPQKSIASLSGFENMPGAHNWQNMAIAYVVGTALGLAPDVILDSFASFKGLAHRCEMVGSYNGIRFINDSKATNLDAAKTALAAFDHIRWIAGGRAKTPTFDGLQAYYDRIDGAYLFGEAAESLERALKKDIPCFVFTRLEEAVEKAAIDAQEGETILFSPACASFDQFPDFEARGDAFRRAAHRIIEGRAA